MSNDSAVDAAVAQILSRLSRPLVVAAQEAVSMGFEALTPALLQVVANVAQGESSPAGTRSRLSSSEPGCLEARRLGQSSQSAMALTQSDAQTSISAAGSETSEVDGRVRSLRDLQDDLASRVLEQSGVVRQRRGSRQCRRGSTSSCCSQARMGGSGSVRSLHLDRVGTSGSDVDISELLDEGARNSTGQLGCIPERSRSSAPERAQEQSGAAEALSHSPLSSSSSQVSTPPQQHPAERHSGPVGDEETRASSASCSSDGVLPPGVVSGKLGGPHRAPATAAPEAPNSSAPPALSSTPALLPIVRGGRQHAPCSEHRWVTAESLLDRHCSRANTDVSEVDSSQTLQASPLSLVDTGTLSCKSQRPCTLESIRDVSSLTRRPSTRVMTNSQVLEHRVRELTQVIPSEHHHGVSDFAEDEVACEYRHYRFERMLSASFRFCGILSLQGADASPRISLAYKCSVTLMLLGAFAWAVVDAALAPAGAAACAAECAANGGARRLLTEVLISASAVGLVASLGLVRGVSRLDELFAMLQGYATQHDLADMWRRAAIQDVAFMLLVTACAVAAEFAFGAPCGGSDWSLCAYTRSVVLTAVMVMVMFALTFLLHVLRILVITVDVFCFQSVQNPDISEATERWNILQALLRKASTAVELALLVLVAMAAFAVPAFIVDQANVASLLEAVQQQMSYIMIFCGVLRVFVLAAAVTDKCMRVPSLLNSLSFGRGIEGERQHLVEYITHSAAGFYICDVRLTLGMVAKFIYIWAVILFGVVGRKLVSN